MTMTADLTTHCKCVLDSLMRHKFSFVFKGPIEPQLHTKPEKIIALKSHMDLGQIQAKLENCRYSTLDEFYTDCELVWNNTRVCNNPYDDLHIMADELQQVFHTQWESRLSQWQTTDCATT
mmetsp:Transcript_30557/g.34111  ORF Transcript_30557/g.34111 Transcript_30557/m.34111 type:complete len:121 (-) Transcript_30557:126-488(-)